MAREEIRPVKNHLAITSFLLGLFLPVMFAVSLLQARFLNNVGMLYLLQDIRCGMLPVSLASLITGWIALVRSRGIRNPSVWMAITGITLSSLVLVWMILAVFHSVLGIGPSE